MKVNTLYVLLIAICFTSYSSHAQLSSLGLDRSVGGSGMFKQTKKPKDKNKQVDFVQEAVDGMEEKLSLDAFQKAAIKLVIEDYKNAMESIYSEPIPDEGKAEKGKIAEEKLEAKMIALLKDEQIVTYLALKNKKANKKGKK